MKPVRIVHLSSMRGKIKRVNSYCVFCSTCTHYRLYADDWLKAKDRERQAEHKSDLATSADDRPTKKRRTTCVQCMGVVLLMEVVSWCFVDVHSVFMCFRQPPRRFVDDSDSDQEYDTTSTSLAGVSNYLPMNLHMYRKLRFRNLYLGMKHVRFSQLMLLCEIVVRTLLDMHM